jgi:hypothetical protein
MGWHADLRFGASSLNRQDAKNAKVGFTELSWYVCNRVNKTLSKEYCPAALHPAIQQQKTKDTITTGTVAPLFKPAPFTLHPSPFTLHPSPFTLHPAPYPGFRRVCHRG